MEVQQEGGHARDHEPLCARFSALPGLFMATAISIGLIVSNASGQTTTGPFYDFVISHRASTQLIVQVLSHLLGACMIWTLTTLLNFRTRLFLAENRSVSLDTLSWWNQLCSRRLNWELPWILTLGLALFYGSCVASLPFSVS